MRRIVANLDFEEELRAASPDPGSRAPYRPLSAAARRVAAEAGARLAAFARPGDRLWLPGPPPPGLDASAGVTVETGLLEELPPADALLAWGETPRIAALRRRGTAGEDAADPPDPIDAATPLIEALWHLPPPDPAVVARVAHRGFGFALARERGWALPGAGLAADVAEVERRVEALGGSPWVAKGAFSAAGRERVFGAGSGALREPETRRRLESLLARHGLVLVEPWVERTADFGCAGLVTGAGARLVTLHGQQVDARGVFRGVVPLPSDFLPLPAAERERIETAFHAVAHALRAAGYRGPFGIDAFRWRRPGTTAGGGGELHPLVEINPRLTFGLVAGAPRTASGTRHGT